MFGKKPNPRFLINSFFPNNTTENENFDWNLKNYSVFQLTTFNLFDLW